MLLSFPIFNVPKFVSSRSFTTTSFGHTALIIVDFGIIRFGNHVYSTVYHEPGSGRVGYIIMAGRVGRGYSRFLFSGGRVRVCDSQRSGGSGRDILTRAGLYVTVLILKLSAGYIITHVSWLISHVRFFDKPSLCITVEEGTSAPML